MESDTSARYCGDDVGGERGDHAAPVDAWNRQDIEGILALTDPEAEYVNAPTAVEPGTRRGHSELVNVFRTQWEAIPGALLEIERFQDRGDEIITVGDVSRTMPGSDARIGNPILISSKFRDGKLIRLERSAPAQTFLKPSKPPGCRSSDVAGERGDRPGHI